MIDIGPCICEVIEERYIIIRQEIVPGQDVFRELIQRFCHYLRSFTGGKDILHLRMVNIVTQQVSLFRILIAETITKKAGGAIGDIPAINIPPEMIEKYTDAIDNYEQRIKSLESQLGTEGTEKQKQLENKAEEEKSAETTPKKEITAEDKEKYKKRISDIKKRIGANKK